MPAPILSAYQINVFSLHSIIFLIIWSLSSPWNLASFEIKPSDTCYCCLVIWGWMVVVVRALVFFKLRGRTNAGELTESPTKYPSPPLFLIRASSNIRNQAGSCSSTYFLRNSIWNTKQLNIWLSYKPWPSYLILYKIFLTHQYQDKIAAILPTTFSNAFFFFLWKLFYFD